MANPLLQTIEALAKEKGIEADQIIAAIEDAVQSGDRPGPAATPEESVSVEDCEQVNREVSTILDVEDPLPFTYVLEVSSPGLDRPLRGAGDYARFAGRLAKVVVSEAVDNQKAFEGRLRGVEDETVVLEAANGRKHKLPLRLITRGRLEVEF